MLVNDNWAHQVSPESTIRTVLSKFDTTVVVLTLLITTPLISLKMTKGYVKENCHESCQYPEMTESTTIQKRKIVCRHKRAVDSWKDQSDEDLSLGEAKK